MLEGPLRLESLVHTQPVVYVAAPLMRRAGMRQGASAEIRAGLGPPLAVQVRSHVLDPNVVLVARPVLRKLGLQRGDRLHAQWDGTRLRLGPVVAIWLPPPRSSPPIAFGAQTAWARDVLALARDSGILAYVTEQPPRGGTRTFGWSWVRRSGWIRRPVPPPHALWRRVERDQRRPIGLQVDSPEEGPLLLSPDIGDKWNIYKLLIDAGLGDHVPWTRPVDSVRELARALRRFGTVFAKPRRGSRGEGLILLSEEGGRFRWYRYGRREQRGVWNGAPTRAQWLDVAGRQPYLIQQAMDTLHLDGRPVDFRWLVQRDGRGIWSETAAAARCGLETPGPTNLSRGGAVRPARDVLDPEDAESGRQLALAAADVVGKVYPTLAELGIDMLLDVGRRWWILDINPRPGRRILRLIDPELRELSIQKPLEYVKYATGFAEIRSEE